MVLGIFDWRFCVPHCVALPRSIGRQMTAPRPRQTCEKNRSLGSLGAIFKLQFNPIPTMQCAFHGREAIQYLPHHSPRKALSLKAIRGSHYIHFSSTMAPPQKPASGTEKVPLKILMLHGPHLPPPSHPRTIVPSTI